ncbi:beta-lactamase family protein [Acidisoma cellulosilytica]|uniref:Beta-lactamase family protein n=1 Tax=Acidisoma cellulosilyticum TaxID=2802395 RepID=A0A963Z1A2_9PROT|nr:serine hydrolase domain-containing protein [Acidisoma cellulosilyticum]MCB8880706.1 beta-lactamase family protein [Acidisoma cellulosilyticum]
MSHTERAGQAIDALLDRVLAEKRLVGAVVRVQRHGRPFYSKAVGFADREAGTPMLPGTVFRLASMTKPVVSAATLACAEAGLLSIEDEITRFLPDFRPKTPSGEAARITIRHLLTHTAGLSYVFLQPGESPYHAAGVSDGINRPGISLAENLRRLGNLPVSFTPGSAWLYSLATDVLGAVLEKASGQALPEVVRDHITRPLGMADSAFLATAPERLATPYADAAGPGEAPRRMTDPFTLPQVDAGQLYFSPGRATDPDVYASGGAGMVGTAEDYIRFLEAIRLGGAPILNPASAAAFVGDAIPGLDTGLGDPGWGFGLGVAHLRDPAASGTAQNPGSWAWGGVYGTSFWVDPEAGLSAVALTNTSLEGCNGPFTKEIIAATYAG